MPEGEADRVPAGDIGRWWRKGDEAVDRAAAADAASPRVGPPTAGWRALGSQVRPHPSGRGEGGEEVRTRRAIWTGLKHEHAGRRIPTQSLGDDASGGSRPDDDDVPPFVMAHDCQCRTLSTNPTDARPAGASPWLA